MSEFNKHKAECFPNLAEVLVRDQAVFIYVEHPYTETEYREWQWTPKEFLDEAEKAGIKWTLKVHYHVPPEDDGWDDRWY